MSESDNKNIYNYLLIGIIGSIIGGTIVYYVIERRYQKYTYSLQQHNLQLQNNKQEKILKLQERMQKMQENIQKLETQLQLNQPNQIRSQLQAQPQPQPQPQSRPQPQQISTSEQKSPIDSNYKNDERWEITRNKEGYLTSIRVIRDAKVRTT